MTGTLRRYDAFLSYSYAVDGPALAPAVQRGLTRLAKPWYRPHGLRIFRDQTGLQAGAGLGAAIEAALRQSEFFILMASPESARSVWVGREVEYWVTHRDPEKFLIVLTSGTVNWDERTQDFDWDETDALPQRLSQYFAAEPLWVNLAWARQETQLSLRHSRFRSELATLAAPVHGVPKEALDSEDVRQHRLSVRARRAAVLALSILTVVAVGLSLVAARQRQEAVDQRNQAQSRELAAFSQTLGDSDPALSRLLSVAAWRISRTPEARAGMLRAAARPALAVVPTGSAAARALSYSPDGATLAMATNDGALRLRDTTTGAERVVDDVDATIAVVAPDGNLVAVTTRDGRVRLWQVTEGTWFGHPMTVSEALTQRSDVSIVAWRPDSRALVVGVSGSEVSVWDVATQNRTAAWHIGGGRTYDDHRPGADVLFDDDGKTVVTASTDGTLRFWDAATGAAAGFPITAHAADDLAQVSPAMALSADQSTLVTAGVDGTLQFWDTARRTRIGAPVSGHTRANRLLERPSLAFHPDGSLVATGSQDGTVRVWNTGTRQQIGPPLEGHTRPVTAVAFSPDGRTLASTALDGTLRFWDISDHHEVARPLTGFAGPVYSLAFGESGRVLVTGGDNGGALTGDDGAHACENTAWELCSRNENQSIGPALGSLLDESRQGGRRTPLGPTVHFVDVATRERRGELTTGVISAVQSLALSPDGGTLAIGGIRLADRTDDRFGGVLLWDAEKGATLGDLTTDGIVRSLAFSPDGATVATGGGAWGDKGAPDLVRWTAATRRQADSHDLDDVLYAVAYAPAGDVLATGGEDGVLRLWTATGTHELTGHAGPIGAVAYNADGTLLASAGDDGVVRLWDPASRRLLGEPLLGHTGPIYSVAFSPDSRLLATGSGDNSVRVWDLATRTQVSEPHLAHTMPVRTVRFSPDGTLLASGGDDSAVRLWDIAYTVDVENALCTTAGRTLTSEEWGRHISNLPYRDICPP